MTTATTQPPTTPKPARRKPRRPKQNHKPVKVVLTAGAFLATWIGSAGLAQQEAAIAAQQAQIAQPEPVTVALVEADGTITERTLDLHPIPQVVVTSRSSR